MLEKLLGRSVPHIIVRILTERYRSQLFYVRWGNTISSGFSLSNGVRQGEILNPFAFNVYMDELSCKLDSVKIRCYCNNDPSNHLFYADDSVLLAPTPYSFEEVT